MKLSLIDIFTSAESHILMPANGVQASGTDAALCAPIHPPRPSNPAREIILAL
jgi:hypothetical protein